MVSRTGKLEEAGCKLKRGCNSIILYDHLSGRGCWWGRRRHTSGTPSAAGRQHPRHPCRQGIRTTVKMEDDFRRRPSDRASGLLKRPFQALKRSFRATTSSGASATPTRKPIAGDAPTAGSALSGRNELRNVVRKLVGEGLARHRRPPLCLQTLALLLQHVPGCTVRQRGWHASELGSLELCSETETASTVWSSCAAARATALQGQGRPGEQGQRMLQACTSVPQPQGCCVGLDLAPTSPLNNAQRNGSGSAATVAAGDEEHSMHSPASTLPAQLLDTSPLRGLGTIRSNARQTLHLGQRHAHHEVLLHGGARREGVQLPPRRGGVCGRLCAGAATRTQLLGRILHLRRQLLQLDTKKLV